jgi:hypothetical protein
LVLSGRRSATKPITAIATSTKVPLRLLAGRNCISVHTRSALRANALAYSGGDFGKLGSGGGGELASYVITHAMNCCRRKSTVGNNQFLAWSVLVSQRWANLLGGRVTSSCNRLRKSTRDRDSRAKRLQRTSGARSLHCRALDHQSAVLGRDEGRWGGNNSCASTRAKRICPRLKVLLAPARYWSCDRVARWPSCGHTRATVAPAVFGEPSCALQ